MNNKLQNGLDLEIQNEYYSIELRFVFAQMM